MGSQREDLDPLFQGLTDILMVLMLLLVAAVFNMKEEIAAAEVEMSQPRAYGYAVCVLNPTEDERNPDAYLPLFRQYGEVVMITMVLNNGKLIQSLAKERELEERCPNIDVSAFQEVREEWWEKALWYLSLSNWMARPEPQDGQTPWSRTRIASRSRGCTVSSTCRRASGSA